MSFIVATDFDGTLIQSNQIKLNAFITIFQNQPKSAEILEYCHINHAISRHEKFEYISKNILKITDKQLPEKWNYEFTNLTRTAIINALFIPGVLPFLEHHSKKLYLVSATPLDELLIILKVRNLTQYFKGIYGAPTQKIDALEQISKIEKVKCNDIVYIGDAIFDCKVAHQFGCNFIGVNQKFPRHIKQFKDMKGVLNELQHRK